jgi:hypothetical protein
MYWSIHVNIAVISPTSYQNDKIILVLNPDCICDQFAYFIEFDVCVLLTQIEGCYKLTG